MDALTSSTSTGDRLSVAAPGPHTGGMAVVGDTALGCFLAAHLAVARQDVVVGGARALESLTVSAAGETFTVAVRGVADPLEVGGPADYLFVAWDHEDPSGAEPWLRCLADKLTIVVAVGAELDPTASLSGLVDPRQVIPAIVAGRFARVSDTHVAYTPHPSSDLVLPDRAAGRELAHVFGSAGLRVMLTSDIRAAAEALAELPRTTQP